MLPGRKLPKTHFRLTGLILCLYRIGYNVVSNWELQTKFSAVNSHRKAQNMSSIGTVSFKHSGLHGRIYCIYSRVV